MEINGSARRRELREELDTARKRIRELEESAASQSRTIAYWSNWCAAYDQQRGLLRKALESLVGEAESALEFLEHGIDPTSESEVREELLGMQLEAARQALAKCPR